METAEWKRALEQADDDYLTGLTNKGTVKRAYKELPDVQTGMEQLEDGFQIQVGEETCKLCLPLAESRCSCVSRSICKHIIIGILKLKAEWEKQQLAGGGSEQTAEQNAKAETGQQPEAEMAQKPEAETAQRSEPQQPQPSAASETDKTRPPGDSFPQLQSFPLEKARKAMGSRRYLNLASCARLGIKPQIQIRSTVTVTFPDTGIKVKLLEPLEYSSCSCHKKELCSHKAEAIVWYQLETGILTPEQLDTGSGEEEDLNLERIHSAAQTLQRLLETLLETGLARTAPDVLDSLERMAIICHQEGLADFERQCRTLRDYYQNYFRRMAGFQAQELMVQLMMLYQRSRRLEQTGTAAQAIPFLGRFRSSYRPAGDLQLIGIGARHFVSKSGYEGETCYFIEADSGLWYTYTDARPLFYESSGRRRPAGRGKTPWGLKTSLQELPQLRIRLRQAKANEKNRLSSSSETVGEILGPRAIQMGEIARDYYTDFQQLFQDRIQTAPVQWLPEEEKEYGFDESRHPVLVQAQSCLPARFDKISQTFAMVLKDAQGARLTVEVAYSKEEDLTVRYLEKISRRVQEQNRELPCFVGDVYLKDGEMKLYPIALIEPKEIAYD